MPKFPNPPAAAALAEIPPHWRPVGAGTLLFRVYFRGGVYPTRWGAFRHYGPAAVRFDHQELPARVQERGVLYAAGHVVTALAEVFQARRAIDTHGGEPWLAGFRLARSVRLLDLTGRWPTRAGASMAINSGPRPRAQRPLLARPEVLDLELLAVDRDLDLAQTWRAVVDGDRALGLGQAPEGEPRAFQREARPRSRSSGA